MLSDTWENFFKFFLDNKYWENENFINLLDLIIIIFTIGTLWLLIIKPFLWLLQKWNGTRKK